MTKRIFRSILGVSLAVLLASLVLIVGVLHGYFQDRVSGELESLAEYIAHGVADTLSRDCDYHTLARIYGHSGLLQ